MFLDSFKEKLPTLKQVNGSAYFLRCINCSLCESIKNIYDKCKKQCPSKGKDNISILYSAKLTDVKEKDKEDKMVKNIVMRKNIPDVSVNIG